MSQQPIGFMSYVRFADQHDNGRLTEFCTRLGGEIHMQTGETFEIFQDRNAISWGQHWKQRIDESLDAVTFLIPIITPGFFKSPACRDELERFLERERKLGRNDLVCPVYYVNCPILNDEVKRAADPLAKVIASRQHADWRDLRFEPFTSPQVGKMLVKMALQIVEALERDQHGPPRVQLSPNARLVKKVTASPHTEKAGRGSPVAMRRPAAKTEPPTLIVDALHRGDHTTLTAALKVAKPGDRILVRPGLYKEGIVVDKPVEIIGDGALGEVVIETTGKNAVLFQANMGRIANITLRRTGDDRFYCVDIAQGRLDLEGCDITNKSSACVAIRVGADPRLRRNRIHDGGGCGVLVSENSQGTLEDNDIFGNALSGVQIQDGANPTLRKNRIHGGRGAGVIVLRNALGTLEENDIFDNSFAGVDISDGANPTLRRNRIHDGKSCGVLVSQSGLGIIEENEIFANGSCGVEIREGSTPTLKGNRIAKNRQVAIWVHDGGAGTLEENDLRGNARGAWDISPDCADKVKRSRNKE